jgi:hypothetical protein
MRHVVCAVIHRMCRKAHNKKDVVLLRNARWVRQKALTHPTLRLKYVPFVSEHIFYLYYKLMCSDTFSACKSCR